MAGENTSSTLDGLFKRVWADEIKNLVPEVMKVQRAIKLYTDGFVGDRYVQPLDVAQEQGFTEGGPTDDVMTLNAAAAPSLATAEVQPYQIVLRGQIGYNALFKAAEAGDKAFERATEHVVKNLNRSVRKRLEVHLLYGQRPIATVSSLSSQIISITPASWAPGIWFGSKGMKIDVYQSDGVTSRQTGLVVSSVDMTKDAPTVTVTGTTTGIVNTDLIYLAGTNNGDGTFKSPVGLDRIASNTGTLYNVSASTYSDTWKAATVTSVGNLTLSKILQGAYEGYIRGYEDDYMALIPNRAYEKINADQAVLREYETSEEEVANGFKALTFRGAGGKIFLVPHPYVKEGDSFLVPLGEAKRIASTDITFNRPAVNGAQSSIFFDLTTATGVELRCYTAQTLFIEKPAHLVKMTGITYA